MKRSFFLFVLVAIVYFSFSSISFSKQTKESYSFGFGSNVGFYNALVVEGDVEWEPGLGYGVDLIFEKMFSNNFGFHSGLSFIKAESEFKMTKFNKNYKFSWYQIQLPILFFTSFNAEKVSFELLYGFKIAQTVQASLTDKVTNKDFETLYNISYLNYGVTLGLNIKFRISKFNDFYIGISSDFFPHNLVKSDDYSKSYSYNSRLNAGFLFRTELFPANN